MVALLHLALASRYIRAIVKDERDHEFGGLDRILHDQELLAQLLALLGFPQ